MREQTTAAEDNRFTFREDFPVTAPEFFNFGYDVIDKLARQSRNKLAMVWVNQQGQEKRYTFHDLAQLSNQAANLLIKCGVCRGDRIFMLLPRIPEWWIFSLAMIKIGAVQCPSPVLLTPHDIRERVQFGKFKMIITDSCNAPKAEEIWSECPTLEKRLIVDAEREGWISYPKELQCAATLSRHKVKSAFIARTGAKDPMLMIFTSGTSKMPKMVLHTHDYPLGHRVTASLWHGVGPDDLHFTVSDTGWAKNLWGNYFGQWIAGACLFIYDIRGKFHAEELLSVLEKYEITSFCAPPTVYRMMVLHDLKMYDLRYLRTCTSAGEPLHTKTAQLWQEGTGLTIREGFGQTETVCMIGNFVGETIREGAMGKASPGWNISIHDDNGNPLPDEETGRIAVSLNPRPVGLLDSYVGCDEENAISFQNDYYYTGDKAWRDRDGYFWFVGRSDDVIKSSGYRISPQEVEEAVMQHPAVQEVAIIGVPDPLRGTRIKAYIVLKPGFTASEDLLHDIQNHTKEQTAPYKYPREIEFVENLPKSFSGKIKRHVLRQHAENGGECSWQDESRK